MAGQMTVGKKLTLGFAVVLSLTIVMGIACFVGLSKLANARNDLADRIAGATTADQVPFWTIKQYQNQADLIINKDLAIAKDFDESASQMDKYRDQLEQIVDTPEEKAWFAKLKESDEAFDAVFRTKIMPEVQHQLGDYITKYDGEADEYIEKMVAASRQIEASLKAEVMAGMSDDTIKNTLEKLLSAKDMTFWILRQYQNQADLIINGDMKSVDDFEASVAEMDRNRDIIAEVADTPERKAAMATITEYDEKYDAVFFEKVVPEVTRILENRIAKYDGESDAYMTEVEEAAKKISTSLRAEADEASATFDRVQALVRTLVVAFSIGCVVLGSCIAFVLIRSLTKTLSKIISSLSEGAEQVTSASGQVSSSSQSLAEGATEQAAGLEETSSSLEEMSSMTKQNADNAQQANTLASEARKAADNGTEAMGRMNTAIEEIQKSSDETAKIIKVIDEIAFQTNLLALNAAVEAARAGEAGKGFAVVAEEVRNLAMRSAEAAKNTSSMIEESVKNSKNGVDIAAEVGKVLEEIVQGIGKTTDLVGEIAAASQEQAQGIDQVNTAVAQMDKVTQQNAANAEESASASEELSAQAESMNQIVTELVTLVGGSAKRTTAHSKSGCTTRKLSHSDSVLHSIAKGTTRSHNMQPVAISPGQTAIPLDDDYELNDFNS